MIGAYEITLVLRKDGVPDKILIDEIIKWQNPNPPTLDYLVSVAKIQAKEKVIKQIKELELKTGALKALLEDM